MRTIRVADKIAETVVDAGITALFGLFGDGNLSFMGSLALRDGFIVRQSRHEEGAVFMATGWARATGGPVVAAVTAGPALARTLTPMVAAVRADLPVILYAGDTNPLPDGVGNPQAFDHRMFAELCGALYYRVDGSEPIGQGVRAAITSAIEQSRPLVLSVPEQFADSSWMEGDPSAVGPAIGARTVVHRPALTDPIVPSRVAATRVLDALAGAADPMIVAGSGAVAADLLAQLEELALRTGAMLATTFRAKGAFDGATNDVGLAGLLTHRIQQQAQEKADLILGFGASLHGFGTSTESVFPGVPVLCVGPERYGRILEPHPGDCEIDADVGGVVRALIEELDGPHREIAGFPISQAEARADDFVEFPEVDENGVVDPRRAFIEIDNLISDDAIIVVGGGHFWSWPMMYLSRRQRDFILPLEFGSIGMAVPTAIGVATATADRPVVVFEGDGGVMSEIEEIESAARHSVPLTVAIVDDCALTAEYHKLAGRGLRAGDSAYPAVEFASAARAFGAAGVTVTSIGDLPVAFARRPGGSPTQVVDLRVSINVPSRWYRRVHIRPEPGR